VENASSRALGTQNLKEEHTGMMRRRTSRTPAFKTPGPFLYKGKHMQRDNWANGLDPLARIKKLEDFRGPSVSRKKPVKLSKLKKGKQRYRKAPVQGNFY